MINVAVVGVGSMGRNHARVYNEVKGVKLVAVCDSDKRAAKQISRLYKTRCYFDHKKLIESEELDAASIVTPTSTHKTISKDFINKSVNLLIEKPMASNYKDAKYLTKLSELHGVVILPGHTERFNPVVQKLKRLIEENYFGDIINIVVNRVGVFPPRVKDVSVVTDVAIHDLDLITYLLERYPVTITATGGTAFTNTREDHAEIFMNYKTFGCFINTNWTTPIKIRNLFLTGKKAAAKIDFINQDIEIFKALESDKFKNFNELARRFSNPKIFKPNIRKMEPLKAEIDHFIKSIVSKNTDRIITPKQAANAVKLTQIVRKSIKSGNKQKVRII